MKLDLDRDKLAKKSFEYTRKSAGFAFKAGLIYTVLIFIFSFGGAIGAYHGIAYLGWGGFWSTLCSMIAFFGGALAGVYIAQMMVMGLIQDMLIDAGLEAGKMGYRAAMKKLDEMKSAGKADAPPLENDLQKTDNK